MTEPFEDFEIRDDGDSYNPDLVCPHCDNAVCEVDPGDSLGTLTRVAIDHLASCNAAPTVSGPGSPAPAVDAATAVVDHITH